MKLLFPIINPFLASQRCLQSMSDSISEAVEYIVANSMFLIQSPKFLKVK